MRNRMLQKENPRLHLDMLNRHEDFPSLPFMYDEMEIPEHGLRKIKGEYVEVRHFFVIYHDLDTSKGDKIQEISKKGLSVRIVDKGYLKFTYLNKKRNIGVIFQSMKGKPVSKYTPPNPTTYHEKQPKPIELPVETVKNILETFEHVGSAEARLESLTIYEHIYTNLGTDIHHGNSKLFVRIYLTPIQGITVAYSFGYPGEDVTKKLEQLEEIDLHKFSDYHTISPGQYDVVLSPQVTGMIFHEIGHTFEGHLPEKPEFFDHISISDNPQARRMGGYAYDSEGCKASYTPLIEKGTIRSCLASVFEPGDRIPTGNGRASSFDVQPTPRQSNLEVNIHTEHHKEEELLEKVRNGVYIAQVGQGSVFPEDITYFTKAVCFHIESGELQEPLRNVSFGGKLTDIANSMQYAGTNQEVVPSICWKKGQRLFVTTQAPSTLIRGMPLLCHTSSRSSNSAIRWTNSSTSF